MITAGQTMMWTKEKKAVHGDCNAPNQRPETLSEVKVGNNGHNTAEQLQELIKQLASTGLDMEAVRNIVREELADLPVVEPKTIQVKVGEKAPIEIEGTVHEVFEDVHALCVRRRNVLLIGPAGCGKTHLAEQVAKAMGLRFGFASCSAGQSEGHLGGRLLPIGDNARFNYVISKFVDFYENGGVFLLDEIDASDSNVLLFINSALSNGKAYVPNRIDNPEALRHEDFICIAAANTFGTGANRIYVGRNQLDGSTLDRFPISQIVMDYDTQVESKLITDEELRTEFQRIRTKVNENKLRRIVSTRAMLDAQIMRQAGWSVNKCAKALTCGWSTDELAKVGLN